MFKVGKWYKSGCNDKPMAIFTVFECECDSTVKDMISFFERNCFDVTSVANGEVVAQKEMDLCEFLNFCCANEFSLKYYRVMDTRRRY